MRIHQIVIGASPGDAVSSAALRTRDLLRRWVDADVFAVHVHPALQGDVLDVWDDYPRDGTPSDVVILHVSIGEPGVADFVLRCPERLVLAYHNITPCHWFQEVNPEFARRLRDGRAELPALVAAADAVIADSEFNAAELRALGAERVRVSPPPLDLARLAETTPDAAWVDELVPPEAPLVLVVGQLLPHKRPELAVQAHHFLNVNHRPDAHMVLAGAMRQHQCSSAVVRHVESLRLTTCRPTGAVSDEQLAALYRRADVLLMPSEHEGFGVPLIEAMTFGLPVVTRDFAAIAETAGDAALVLPSGAGAPELAGAVARVLDDEDLSAGMRARGQQRSAWFDKDRTVNRWVRALADLLATSSPA